MNEEYVEINGQKIPLSLAAGSAGIALDSFTKIGISDTLLLAWKSFSTTSFGAFTNRFLIKLREGDAQAMVIGTTTVLGAALLVYLLTKKEEAEEEEDKTGGGNTSKEVKMKESLPLRDFTIEQLREFDGSEGKDIYISLKGDVFDVTEARELYGEGSG